jgi:hypothetical protein
MKWINSTGGPLICAEERISTNWMGVKGLSSVGDASSKTDYSRACAIKDYVGVIPCGIGYVLVLGDEPLQSAFLLTEAKQIAIVRWMYAKPGEDVASVVTSLCNTVEISKRVVFDIKEGMLVMFDSSFDGSTKTVDFMQTEIKIGQYEITAERIEVKNKYSFLVHRFLAI